MISSAAIYSTYPASTGSARQSLKHYFSLHNIDADGLKNGVLDTKDILILPGITGEASPYHETIGEDGLQKLGRRVHDNGLVIAALCAGASALCARTIWEPPTGNPRSRRSNAPLFNATARGPIKALYKPYSPEDRMSDVSLTPILYKNRDNQVMESRVCYGNGPVFEDFDEDNPDIEIIARFKDVPGQPPAIVSVRHGEGTVFLLGVHPEISWQSITEKSAITNPMTRKLLDILEPHEQTRQIIWNDLMLRIKSATPRNRPLDRRIA